MADAQDVHEPDEDDEGSEPRVRHAPPAVVEPQPPPEKRQEDDQDQRSEERPERGAQEGVPRVEVAQVARLDGEEDQRVRESEGERHQPRLPVEVQHRVDALLRRDGAEARGERELEGEHREGDEAQRDPELAPEAAPRRYRLFGRQEERQRGEHHVETHPDHRAPPAPVHRQISGCSSGFFLISHG